MHRVFVDAPLEPSLSAPGAQVTIEGDEAFHALRVKRVLAGEAVSVVNGRGVELVCEVAPSGGAGAAGGVGSGRRRGGEGLVLRVVRRVEHARVSPRVEVWSAIPKGDRAAEMIDQLSQVGASLWRGVVCERSVERELSPGKRARLERVAVESAKQSGRAWVLEIGPVATVAGVLEAMGGSPAAGGPRVRWLLADVPGAGGGAAGARGAGCGPGGEEPAGCTVVMIGPEGGWTEAERGALIGVGASASGFGPVVMRIETAAVAAAAVVMNRAAVRPGP